MAMTLLIPIALTAAVLSPTTDSENKLFVHLKLPLHVAVVVGSGLTKSCAIAANQLQLTNNSASRCFR